MTRVKKMFGKKYKDLTEEERKKYHAAVSNDYFKRDKGATQKRYYDRTDGAAQKKQSKKQKDDDYIHVYYLPEEHYCGISTRLTVRLYQHKADGRNINGCRILYSTKCRIDARNHENLFHSWLGMNGMNKSA